MNYTNILLITTVAGVVHFSHSMDKKIVITPEILEALERKASLDFCTPSAHLYTSLDYDPVMPHIPKHLGYKEQLKIANDAMAQQRDMYHPMDTALMNVYQEYNEVLADIALNSHDMPGLEKLKYLFNHNRYTQKKQIIISLIESGMNPNDIVYQRTTALEEGIKQEDVDLVQVLLKAGAMPSSKNIEQAQQSLSDGIKKLFELYCLGTNIQEQK